MADNVPNPNPPVPPLPPKKAETGKVQPKKETVRISLPPKPTAAPTIKLPTLPPGGLPPPASPVAAPAAGPVTAVPAPARVAPPVAAPAASKPAVAAAPARPAAAVAAPVSAARPAPAMAAAPARKKVSGLDLGLAIAASLMALGAVVSVVLLLQLK